MAIIVESYLDRRKVNYDLVKFHNVLTETLVKKGILTKQEFKTLYKKSE